MPRIDIDWLRLTRVMTQYVVPGLLAVAFLVEIAGDADGSRVRLSDGGRFFASHLIMICACGWIVFLWDIDRLFFSLERKIDTQTVSGTTDAYGQCRCKTREAPSDVTCTAAEMVAVAQACAVKGAPLRGRAELALDRATRRQGNGYAVNGMYALAHGTSENAKVIPRASDRGIRRSWRSCLWLGVRPVTG